MHPEIEKRKKEEEDNGSTPSPDKPTHTALEHVLIYEKKVT
jgi:hypothetical protein